MMELQPQEPVNKLVSARISANSSWFTYTLAKSENEYEAYLVRLKVELVGMLARISPGEPDSLGTADNGHYVSSDCDQSNGITIEAITNKSSAPDLQNGDCEAKLLFCNETGSSFREEYVHYEPSRNGAQEAETSNPVLCSNTEENEPWSWEDQLAADCSISSFEDEEIVLHPQFVDLLLGTPKVIKSGNQIKDTEHGPLLHPEAPSSTWQAPTSSQSSSSPTLPLDILSANIFSPLANSSLMTDLHVSLEDLTMLENSLAISSDLALLENMLENPPPVTSKDIEDITNILGTEMPQYSSLGTAGYVQNYASVNNNFTGSWTSYVIPSVQSYLNTGFNNIPSQNRFNAVTTQNSTVVEPPNAFILQSNPVPRSSSVQMAPPRSIECQTIFIQGDVPPKKHMRHILPKPPVPKTVSITAKDRLLKKMDINKKRVAHSKIEILPAKELTRDLGDGDNHLMIFIRKLRDNLLETVYALVEKMRHIDGALEATNNDGESALYIASVFLPEEPLVARYIAETLLDMDVNIAELIYEDGQSLAHCVSERGDSHSDVLAELLSLKDTAGKPVFNLNKPNDRFGHTPLHVAAWSHGKGSVRCITTIRFLVQLGANLLEQDWQAGFSVLHLAVREACDPPLVLAILEEARNKGGSEEAANQVTYNGDTPLHLVAVNDTVCVKKQCEAFRLLVYHGAQRGKRNRGGKVALALVAKPRKEEIRRALPRR